MYSQVPNKCPLLITGFLLNLENLENLEKGYFYERPRNNWNIQG